MTGALTRLMNAPLWAQRLTAIIGFLVVLALLAGMIAAMALTLDAKRRQLVEIRETAGRFARIAALEKGLQEAGSTDNRSADASLFVEAASAAIARASLQARITAVAGSHGLQVVSAGSLPDRSEQGFQLVGLRADVSGAFDAVHGMVLDIESALPPNFIRELNLRLSGAPSEKETGPPQLTVQIKVFAAYRQPAATDAAAAQRAEVVQ
jgi:hypothetical protein